MIVVSAYPVSVSRARERASLILAGGLLQALSMLALRSIEKAQPKEPTSLPMDFPVGGFLPAAHTLKQNLALHSEAFRYGLRMALTLATTAGAARWLSLESGFWVPMTALLLLKPDFHQTLVRGVARIVGTLIGAGVATLIAATARPGPLALTVLIVSSAWLCYRLLRVSSATYTVCMTVYIVFLLGLAGLTEMRTVKYRVINTAFGGLVALLAYALWPVSIARD